MKRSLTTPSPILRVAVLNFEATGSPCSLQENPLPVIPGIASMQVLKKKPKQLPNDGYTEAEVFTSYLPAKITAGFYRLIGKTLFPEF